MKPIHKLNGGNGATLCVECSVIICEGLKDILYCDKCNKTKQQTAVEWLIDKLTDEPHKFLFLSDKPEMNELIKLIKKAKEKEKQQIIDAYDKAKFYDYLIGYGKKYYNETFNK